MIDNGYITKEEIIKYYGQWLTWEEIIKLSTMVKIKHFRYVKS